MIVILGAGPVGLSTAYHLQKDHLILEQNTEPGGLCRSFQLGGFVFDLGGHAFFTRSEPVRELLWKLAQQEVFTQPRSAWVYSHGTTIPYPFQANLFGLPVHAVKECLLGLVEVRQSSSSAELASNVLDWILRSFGPGIAKHFLIPYNTKLWAHPLETLQPHWTGQRIVKPDLDAIFEGALHRVNFTEFDNSMVSYPISDGFWGFFRGFLPHTGRLLLERKATRISLRNRWVETAQGERYEFRYLVSSIPLTELVQITEDVPSAAREAASRLRHNSLYLVNLVFDRPNITTMHRLYVADPEIPFHKLVFNSTSAPSLASDHGFPIQAEVSFSDHKPVTREGLEDAVLSSLRSIGLVTPDDRVIASSVITVPLAYPVYDRYWADAREFLLKTFRQHGVYCVGRFGDWSYINSDAAVLRGMEVASLLNRLPS